MSCKARCTEHGHACCNLMRWLARRAHAICGSTGGEARKPSCTACCVQIGAMIPGRNRLPTEDDPEPEPVEVQLSRASLGQTGQHITLSLKPGASQVCCLALQHCAAVIMEFCRMGSNFLEM